MNKYLKKKCLDDKWYKLIMQDKDSCQPLGFFLGIFEWSSSTCDQWKYPVADSWWVNYEAIGFVWKEKIIKFLMCFRL